MTHPEARCADPACTERHCDVHCGRHVDALDSVCIYCLGTSRRWLKTIPRYADTIRNAIDGWPASSPGISDIVSRNAEIPLVGGDRLALVSPGGDGRNASGHAHAADELRHDPPSVVAVLESWERDWRELRRLGGASTPPTLDVIAGWLGENLDWAARHHVAFRDFYRELRGLHALLEFAAGEAARPVEGFVDCLDCPGARLQRRWLKDGLDDLWQCPRCARRYLVAEYFFALRANLEETA